MNRRSFITFLAGGAALLPVARVARAQRAPVVGVVHPGSPDAIANRNRMAVFRQGLNEAGFAEGRNVAVEYHWANNNSASLQDLVADLVRRRVEVIAAVSSTPAALAAKSLTTAIPIVFETGGDPVEAGLVPSLNRPGGNVTGISSMNGELAPKQLGILYELLPQATRFALFVNPNNPNSVPIIANAETASRALNVRIDIFRAKTNAEIDAGFASLVQARPSALLFSPEPFFNERRTQILTLAALHRIPAMYWQREMVEAGGLMSYGASVSEQYRQAGIYVGRILKGDKPADLPILRPTKFEFLINLQTARALGLEIPATLLARADEVIE